MEKEDPFYEFDKMWERAKWLVLTIIVTSISLVGVAIWAVIELVKWVVTK